LQGKWSADEDARLLLLYRELGPKWKEIGGRMGRLDRACRDRARDLNYGQPLNTGALLVEFDFQLILVCYQYVAAVSPRGQNGPAGQGMQAEKSDFNYGQPLNTGVRKLSWSNQYDAK
jgi:hypothetical protein